MSPRGHRLPFPILAGTPLLMTVLLLLSTATGQEADDYLPPRPNPLRFLGFASAHGGKTRNKLEIELGIVMKDNVYDTVEIWATLKIDDTTYVPGPCPNKDHKEESIAKYEDGALSLSFFFGRPGNFTTTYLKIEAPNRFYSLSALSGKILFANKDRTLKLALQSDSENEFVWANSSLTERRSFLHFMVKQTLQNALRRVTQSDRFLDGDVFIRDTAHQTGSDFPFLFGKVDKYLRCASNEFPSHTNRTSYTKDCNTSYCSSWYSVEDDNDILETFAAVFLYSVYIYVGLSTSFLLTVIAMYRSRAYHYLETKTIFYKEGEKFPRFLNARQVILGNAPKCYFSESSSENNPPIVGDSTTLSKFEMYKIPILISIGVVLFIIASMLLLLLYSYFYYYSNYNVADMESKTCWQDRSYANTIGLASSLAICLLLYSASFFYHAWKKDIASPVVLLLQMVFSIPTGLILSVIVLNVSIIACYTLAGLVFFHFEKMISVLVVAIVVMHDICKVGAINETIWPEIVKYKAALDAANCKLRAKECKIARTSKNRSRSEKTISQLQRERLQVLAMLRLSATHTASEDGQLKRFLAYLGFVKFVEEKAAPESYADRYDMLVEIIRYRFVKYVLSSIGQAMAAIVVLYNVQRLLINFGVLTG